MKELIAPQHTDFLIARIPNTLSYLQMYSWMNYKQHTLSNKVFFRMRSANYVVWLHTSNKTGSFFIYELFIFLRDRVLKEQKLQPLEVWYLYADDTWATIGVLESMPILYREYIDRNELEAHQDMVGMELNQYASVSKTRSIGFESDADVSYTAATLTSALVSNTLQESICIQMLHKVRYYRYFIWCLCIGFVSILALQITLYLKYQNITHLEQQICRINLKLSHMPAYDEIVAMSKYLEDAAE